MLSRYYSSLRAVVIQAIAFGIWHTISLHAVFTAITGLIYGLIYLKRRKILVLILSHGIADVVNISLAFLR